MSLFKKELNIEYYENLLKKNTEKRTLIGKCLYAENKIEFNKLNVYHLF